MDRRQFTVDFFTFELLDVAELVIVPADVLLAASPDDSLHRPFGFLPPDEHEPGEFLVRLSPDLIVRSTATLGEDDLREYLAAVALHLQLHVTHAGRDINEIERLIDSVTYDLSPATSALVNRVQMGAAADPG